MAYNFAQNVDVNDLYPYQRLKNLNQQTVQPGNQGGNVAGQPVVQQQTAPVQVADVGGGGVDVGGGGVDMGGGGVDMGGGGVDMGGGGMSGPVGDLSTPTGGIDPDLDMASQGGMPDSISPSSTNSNSKSSGDTDWSSLAGIGMQAVGAGMSAFGGEGTTEEDRLTREKTKQLHMKNRTADMAQAKGETTGLPVVTRMPVASRMAPRLAYKTYYKDIYAKPTQEEIQYMRTQPATPQSVAAKEVNMADVAKRRMMVAQKMLLPIALGAALL